MEFRRNKKQKFWRHILSMPFIYGIIFPVILFDFFLEIFHQVGFRLYQIPLVRRSNYIQVDRYKLSKLNNWEKANCIYCGYVNGFLAYSTEVAGRTEKYWCGIKHHKTQNFHEPNHHSKFKEYKEFN